MNDRYRNSKEADEEEDSVDPKWRGEGNPCNITERNGKSGVAITYVRPSLCFYPIPIPDVIELENYKRNPYEIIPGHATGITLRTKNKAILYNLGAIISAAKMQYIIMGDWQLNPEELALIGWLNTINVHVIATDEITCRQKNRNTEGSVIDYAVVSNWVMPKVKHIRVTDDADFSPHKYVEMVIGFKGATISETRAKKPRSFPDDRPIGPANNYGRPANDNEHVTLEQHARRVMEFIETNLIHVFLSITSRGKMGPPHTEGGAMGWCLKMSRMAIWTNQIRGM